MVIYDTQSTIKRKFPLIPQPWDYWEVLRTRRKPPASAGGSSLAFLAGVSAVSWLAEQITSIAAERGTPIETITGLSLLVGLMFLTSGSAILMGTMYYRSGIHEEFVNNFRNHLKIKNNTAKAKNKQYSIQIGTMSFKESNQGLNSLELSSEI